MNSDRSFRYAMALFQKTVDDSDSVLKDFEFFCSLLDKVSFSHLFFHHPSVSMKKKREVIKGIVKTIESNPLFERFLLLILEKKMIFLASSLLNHYRDFVDKKKGLLSAVLEFSSQENEKTIEHVKQHFEKLFLKKILWTFVHNNDAIAGFSVFIDGNFYDARLCNQLEKMKAKFIS